MLNLRENKGITLATLVIMVVILFILTRVTLVLTTKFTSQIRVDSYFSEMITIKAKAKVIAEEVNAEIWNISEAEEKKNKRNSLYVDKYNMIQEVLTEELKTHLKTSLANQNECFVITAETLKKMGIADVSEANNYIVVYSTDDYTNLDIIYKPGIYAGGDNYYSLAELQAILQPEE